MKIPGYPAYEAYEDGRVANINSGRTLRPENTQNGYQRVTLCRNGGTKRFLLHRLIAIVFIPNPEAKPCVNHKDGDKRNNRVENLEWCSYSENEAHSYGSLGKKAVRGESHYNAKLSVYDCAQIIAMRARGDSCRAIAKSFGICHQHVSDITRGLKRAG